MKIVDKNRVETTCGALPQNSAVDVANIPSNVVEKMISSKEVLGESSSSAEVHLNGIEADDLFSQDLQFDTNKEESAITSEGIINVKEVF